MKIRTQLNILIVALAALPLFCLISMPVYHYVTSPQRYLMKGYREMHESNTINLSEQEWDMLKARIQTIPPNVESMFYHNGKVVLSNMKGIKQGTDMTFDQLFHFILSTSDIYDYQVQSPYLQNNESSGMNPVPLYKAGEISMIISRIAIADKNSPHPNRFLVPAFFTILIFETFMILLVMQLSKTISSSITMLEKTTQKIADGQLDTKIEVPSGGRNSNEITSLAESLEKMRISLKDDQQRRTKFIMGVSHDLRTPVALIKGYTEAITDGVVNDRDAIMNSLTIVHSKADQLENMINDLINYVKLNNSEWLNKLEYIDVEPFVRDFVASAEMTSGVYKRNLSTEVNIDPSIKVKMDKALVSRALENIYTNALRYSSDGDSIEIKAESTEECVLISIKDTGKGISKEDQQHIFDLFYRGTNSRREQGMGIGLSVVKTIIDSHGWTIDVDSTLGEGTKFTIKMPLKEKK